MIAVTVTLILDVADSSEAADACNEILREQQRDWSPQSCLLDYAVNLPAIDLGHLPVAVSYQEGEAFA